MTRHLYLTNIILVLQYVFHVSVHHIALALLDSITLTLFIWVMYGAIEVEGTTLRQNTVPLYRIMRHAVLRYTTYDIVKSTPPPLVSWFFRCSVCVVFSFPYQRKRHFRQQQGERWRR